MSRRDVSREVGGDDGEDTDGLIAVMPVPDDVENCDFAFFDHGRPQVIREYRNESGRLLFVQTRYILKDADGSQIIKEGKHKKTDRYWCVVPSNNGHYSWTYKWGAIPRPRPLYRLDMLSSRPDAFVIVAEGEKAADACQDLFPAFVAMSWVGGANSVKYADFSKLRGREVVLWPDNDEAGLTAMATAVTMLDGVARSVRIVSHIRLASLLGVASLPNKHDAADMPPEMLASGMALEPLLDPVSPVAAKLAPADDGSVIAGAPPIDWQPLVDRIATLAKSDVPSAVALALSPECLTVLARLDATAETRARLAIKLACPQIGIPDFKRAIATARLEFQVELVSTPAEARKASGRQILNPADPMEQATIFVMSRFQHQGVPTLQHYEGVWLEWDETRWIPRQDGRVRQEAYQFLDSCLVLDSEANKHQPFDPTKKDVDLLVDALRANRHCRAESMPSWVDEGARVERPRVGDVIAFRNGLLDVSAWLADPAAALMRHTPRWFSSIALPFPYDPEATCPEWEAFLTAVWGTDSDCALALSMWFGYLLTPDTAQHKLVILVGPKRAGKGTIVRVLEALLGRDNVCSPGLTSLAKDFGCQPLIGKLAAMIPDAHLGHGGDAVAVLEKLKSITGEDSITINRKHVAPITVRLTARFTIACNELVALPDPSGALAGRSIIFPFSKSFDGQEDHDLTKRLLAELPGILNWSLRGLRALRERGRLLQPAAGEQTRHDMARLSSPVLGFLEDACTYPSEGSVLCSLVFEAWKLHAEANGHHHGSKEGFGQKLLGAAAGVIRRKIGPRAAQAGHYFGLTLKAQTIAVLRSRMVPGAAEATRSEASGGSRA